MITELTINLIPIVTNNSKSMKLSLSLFLTTFCLTILNCQSTPNILSKSEFYNISFNEMTIQDLIESEGDLNELSVHFGEPVKSNINEKIGIKGYTFSSFRIGFREGLSGFTVLNNKVIVNIAGKALKIGDHINVLGNEIVFNTDLNGDKSILFQFCEGCNNYISIDFDQETKLITEIKYIDLT
jgi:hypothetical protein